MYEKVSMLFFSKIPQEKDTVFCIKEQIGNCTFTQGYESMLANDMWNMHCILLPTYLKIFSWSVYFLKGPHICWLSLFNVTDMLSLLWMNISKPREYVPLLLVIERMIFIWQRNRWKNAVLCTLNHSQCLRKSNHTAVTQNRQRTTLKTA